MATELGAFPDGTGSRPTDRASDAVPASIPNADLQAHLAAIAEDRLWGDEICSLVDWAFSTVSRNPSDHEAAVAYRRAVASVLHHTRAGWKWEHGSFMGARGWMWRKPASAIEAGTAETVEQGSVHESAVAKPDAHT